jgi:hypothetical protein
MQMITWPRGGRPDAEQTTFYADEVMSGFEYAAAATMVQAGLPEEGLMVVRAVHDRYDGRRREGLTPGDTASWGYSGNPFGDDECGKFYARALSVWSLLLACQGFVYDGPAGVIGFRPVWRPEDHRSFFTAAEGWGVFAQRRGDRSQIERIEVRHGRLRVKTMVFEVPEEWQVSQVTVILAGAPVEASLAVEGADVRVIVPASAVVRAGQALEVELG